MKVEELIKRPPYVVSPSTPLIDAIKIMAMERIGSLVIVQDEEVVGIITEKDVIRALASNVPLNTPVEKVGTIGKLVTIKWNSRISEAAKRMRDERIRHLIVLDEDGSFRGVISARDIVYNDVVVKALEERGL